LICGAAAATPARFNQRYPKIHDLGAEDHEGIFRAFDMGALLGFARGRGSRPDRVARLSKHRVSARQSDCMPRERPPGVICALRFGRRTTTVCSRQNAISTNSLRYAYDISWNTNQTHAVKTMINKDACRAV